MRYFFLVLLFPFLLVCNEGKAQRKLIKRVNALIRIQNPSETLPPDPYFGCTGIVYSKWRTMNAAFVNNMNNTTDWHDYADVISNSVGTFTLVERRYTSITNTSYMCTGLTYIETAWEVIIENAPTKSGTGILPPFCEDNIPNNSLSLSPLIQYPGHLSNINWILTHLGFFSPIINNYSADARLNFENTAYGINTLRANIPYVNDPTFELSWTVDYNGLKKREFSFLPSNEIEIGEKVEIRRTNYLYSNVNGVVEWDFGDEFKSSNIEPSHFYYSSGPKNLILKLNTNNCSFSRNFPNAFTVKDYEVITADPIKDLNISIYPNPIEKELRIEGVWGNYQWCIFDFFGNKVAFDKGFNSEQQIIIDLEKYGLKRGTYIININGFNKKILKQ